MKRSAVLLDVDETLSFTMEVYSDNVTKINWSLIRLLKDRDIKDIWLFTDMTLDASLINHRTKLISLLRSHGFVIHGVITPNDLLWRNFDPKVNYHSYRVDDIRRLFQLNQCGNAYAHAEHEMESNGELSRETMQRSQKIARELVPHLSRQRKYSHKKGLMLEHFLSQLPDWVDKITLIDDQKRVLETITQVCKNFDEYGVGRPCIDSIHVRERRNYLGFASEPANNITTALQNADFVPWLLIQFIEREINRLRSQLHFCTSTRENTIEDLQDLRLYIQAQFEQAATGASFSKKPEKLGDFLRKQTTPFIDKFINQAVVFLTESVSSSISFNFSSRLQAQDVQKIFTEIGRLRFETAGFFYQSRILKVQCIMAALICALNDGYDDVTQDTCVRQMLFQPEFSPYLGIFGVKKANRFFDARSDRVELDDKKSSTRAIVVSSV